MDKNNYNDISESFRKESDTLGEILVPCDKMWGAQTQRSFQNFKIGDYRMPEEIIQAIVLIKKCCAMANCEAGCLALDKAMAVQSACDKILNDKDLLDTQFPLVVWQTGSGTQTNMNCNEVIAYLAGQQGTKLHPNDDINKGQSTNDVFPSALHIAAVKSVVNRLLPAIKNLENKFEKLSAQNEGVCKVGRTHLQDATPMLFCDEVSAWIQALKNTEESLSFALTQLYRLPLGGTAVGNGLNTAKGFSFKAVAHLAQQTGLPFVEEQNKFFGLSTKNAIVNLNGVLATLATCLIKIANDIRFLGCGPNAGIGELILPANEPGSSIMPGKVNPTQCEALIMVSCEVLGNDCTVKAAHAQGQLQLNAAMPVLGFKTQESLRLLSDAINSFADKCIDGTKTDLQKIKMYADKNLMVATALTPVIGYAKAASLVKKAYKENTTIKYLVEKEGLMSAEQYDKLIATVAQGGEK